MDIVKRLGKVCLFPILMSLAYIPATIFVVGAPIEYIICGDFEYSLYPINRTADLVAPIYFGPGSS
jgi:hypothetical protein